MSHPAQDPSNTGPQYQQQPPQYPQQFQDAYGQQPAPMYGGGQYAQQPGYGYPPGGYQQAPPAPEPRNGFGITALVLAIIGLVFGIVPLTGFLAAILGALAILFGLLGLGRVRRGRATNKVMSWIGTLLGIGALALGIWGMVIVFSGLNELGNELEEIGDSVPTYSPPTT